MNQNKGTAPFANMGLTESSEKVDAVVNNLTSAIDKRAVNKETKVTSRPTKPRPRARQIYFSADVDQELSRLKSDERANISAVVEKAVREHLGL